MQVVVIGGGVIGLSVALAVLRRGHSVTLLDAAPEAREASWAAGGMLAPHNEADGDGPLWRFGCRSLERWPGFLADAGIESEAVDFRQRGSLMPVLDAQDRHQVEAKMAFLAEVGVGSQWLDAARCRAIEPAIAAPQGALAVPGGQIDPRRLLHALCAVVADAGGVLCYRQAVVAIEDGSVVTADGRCHAADEVVLASGAWTSTLADLSDCQLPGEPVKGQLLRFAVDDGLLQRYVHCRHAYCIPRRGAGIVVGASMVSSGFDRSEDPEAIGVLADGARRLLPVLRHHRVCETWTGLRPRLQGGLPCIGRVRPGLVVATGHFRNGILLAPGTADAVAALLIDGVSGLPAALAGPLAAGVEAP